ncbi:hypothetical protein K2X33_07605 [bacterium]|nr:hypothetical protein [bacterium]
MSKLKTSDQCRVVMDRARSKGEHEIYRNVFRRYCEIAGKDADDPADPIIRDFHETLAAYEQLLTERNGRTTSASRTRQKINNKGVIQSLVEWTAAKKETEGFGLLLKAGLAQYTGEYLVVRYADRFPPHIVELAKARLSQHKIALPLKTE